MNNIFNISQILVYYDVPELIVSTDKVGTKYLCLLIEEDEDKLNYLTIPISESRLAQFKVGDIDLKKIYSFPELNEPFILSLVDENTLKFQKYLTEPINEDWLPEEGFYLLKAFKDNSKIVNESINKNNAVVHLALSDSRNDLGVDADDLGDIVKLYSILLENTFKKSLQEHKVKEKKQYITPENYKLRAFASSAASFNVHLYSESQKDLFGNCLVEYGLEKIDELFSNVNNELELIKSLRSIKGHAVSSFTKILKKISSDDLKLKHKWYAPNRHHINSYAIDKEKAEGILKILSKTEELTEETKEFVGYFVQVDIPRKTWKLKTEEDNKPIFGESSTQEQLKGLTVDSVLYKIICEEVIEEFTVSEKERVRYIIKSIQEI